LIEAHPQSALSGSAQIDDHCLMSDFDVADIKRIAQQAALEYSVPVEIVGVVMGGEGSEYVELLVNIDECTVAPCQLAIGIFRNSPEADLRREIGTRLRRQLDENLAVRELED
jgi:hypothetical protein